MLTFLSTSAALLSPPFFCLPSAYVEEWGFLGLVCIILAAVAYRYYEHHSKLKYAYDPERRARNEAARRENLEKVYLDRVLFICLCFFE